MGWVAIRAKIKTKLDGLVPATLGAVLNGEQNPQTIKITAYPLAIIVRQQTMPEFFTNREDLQEYNFDIQLLYPLTSDDYSAAEIAMDSVVDAVAQAFLGDAGLTGSVDGRIQPIPMGGSVITWNGKPHRRDLITLKCKSITPMA